MSITQHLRTWDDTIETEAYLQSFKMSIMEADIREENCLLILRKQLVDKTLSVFIELNVMGKKIHYEGKKIHYEVIKNNLLERLESTPQQAIRAVWLEKSRQDEILTPFFKEKVKCFQG